MSTTQSVEQLQRELKKTVVDYIETEYFGLFGGFCGRDSGIGPAQRAKTTIWN